MAGLAEKHGFVALREKRGRAHFVWLVRFQVLGERFPDIARTPGEHRDVATVEKTVRRLAKRIGLKLRGLPKGRPRGKSSR